MNGKDWTDSVLDAAEKKAAVSEKRPDRVSLKRIPFYAYHGTSQAEQQTGRQYEVDCDCWLDTRRAGVADQIQQSVDYTTIFEISRRIMGGPSVKLLETLAEQIAAELLKLDRLSAVTICVRKLHPPVDGPVGAAEVEITRTRQTRE